LCGGVHPFIGRVVAAAAQLHNHKLCVFGRILYQKKVNGNGTLLGHEFADGSYIRFTNSGPHDKVPSVMQNELYRSLRFLHNSRETRRTF
jgi:hypothetical protein